MAVTSMRSSSIENYKKSNKMAGEILYPEMTGGTEATFTEGNSTYKSHTFTSSTTATVSRAGYADLLIVAGGGGASEGGSNSEMGGGGGAGGVLYRENVYLPAGSWTVAIGAGSPASQWSGNASQGENSFFYPGSDPELGWGAVGGGGGGRLNSTGGFGGSGGGSGSSAINNSSFFATQGHQGGAGLAGNSGGGGGGAGADGTNGTNATGRGKGGDGRIVNIIPTATATSQSVGEVSGNAVYLGGGAGGGVAGSPVADGGLGGGAIGATGNQTAPSGDPNTGGGGGGAEGLGGNPGAGGSGVVIVRYKTS